MAGFNPPIQLYNCKRCTLFRQKSFPESQQHVLQATRDQTMHQCPGCHGTACDVVTMEQHQRLCPAFALWAMPLPASPQFEAHTGVPTQESGIDGVSRQNSTLAQSIASLNNASDPASMTVQEARVLVSSCCTFLALDLEAGWELLDAICCNDFMEFGQHHQTCKLARYNVL